MSTSYIHGFLAAACAVSLLAVSGCVTPETLHDDSDLIPDSQLEKIYKNAKHPRRYSITVYSSGKGHVFDGVHRLHPNQWAELKLAEQNKTSLPIMPITFIDGSQLNALLDTSAPYNMLTVGTALQHDLIPMGLPAYRLVLPQMRDQLPLYFFLATKLKLESLHIENAMFYARPTAHSLGPSARGTTNLFQAVIGYDFLRQFEFVQIDPFNKRVLVSSDRPYDPPDAVVIAEADIVYVEGMLAVAGQVNSTKTPILLDTGGAYEFLPGSSQQEPLRHVALGSLVLRQMETAAPGAAGPVTSQQHPRIGMETLSKYVITLNNKDGKVYFQRPPQ